MSDLISRISLKQSIVTSMILGDEKTLEKIIDEEPSIDAVPVIRCKDCKFWTHIKRTNRYWCKTDDGLYDLNPSPDDFCSRAERRTDETN